MSLHPHDLPWLPDTGAGADPASRQLAGLRRQQAALSRRDTRDALVAAAVAERQAGESEAGMGAMVGKQTDIPLAAAEALAEERAQGAEAWRSVLEVEAGGGAALRGDVPAAVPRLLELADRLASPTGLSLGPMGLSSDKSNLEALFL